MTEILKIKNLKEARRELKKIGVHNEAVGIMAPKAVHTVLKLEGVDCRAANIVKQELLAVGGEAAVSKVTLLLKAKTDILVMGTLKQLCRLVRKLRRQKFLGLPKLAREIEIALKRFK